MCIDRSGLIDYLREPRNSDVADIVGPGEIKGYITEKCPDFRGPPPKDYSC